MVSRGKEKGEYKCREIFFLQVFSGGGIKERGCVLKYFVAMGRNKTFSAFGNRKRVLLIKAPFSIVLRVHFPSGASSEHENRCSAARTPQPTSKSPPSSQETKSYSCSRARGILCYHSTPSSPITVILRSPPICRCGSWAKLCE